MNVSGGYDQVNAADATTPQPFFSFDSAGTPYLPPMLAATPKTKRLLERIQLVLTFASVCAVVDASLVHAHPTERAGYYAQHTQRSEAQRDRLVGDLARTERKRREAALRDALEERQLRA